MVQWQPAAQPEPTVQWQPRGPAQPGAAPGYGRAAQPTQWQPAPQYGEVSPIEHYQQQPYGIPQYGRYPPGVPAIQQFPPSQNGKPSGSRNAWLAAGVAAIVVAGGAIAAVVVANRGSDDSTAPSMVSALTISAGAHPPSGKTGSATPTPTGAARRETPVIQGYQVVVAPDRGAAYDVPADWTVASEGTIGGFGEPPNAISGRGYAAEGKDYCPGSTRTVSFLTGSKNDDSAGAATEIGTRLAVLAYADSAGTPGAPQPLDSLDGSQHGMFVETRGTIAQAKPGCATEYSVYTFATPSDAGNFVMVIAADRGVPNAVDTAIAQRIFSSIRPHTG